MHPFEDADRENNSGAVKLDGMRSSVDSTYDQLGSRLVSKRPRQKLNGYGCRLSGRCLRYSPSASESSLSKRLQLDNMFAGIFQSYNLSVFSTSDLDHRSIYDAFATVDYERIPRWHLELVYKTGLCRL
jgi:hypothetical protein